MTEALIFAGVALFFGLMIYGLVAERRARARMTEEEWENRDRETSTLGAAVMGFDKILRPDLEKAAAVQHDKQRGQFPDGEHQGLNLNGAGKPVEEEKP
ncbi:MAG TPA: hypothetical protein VFD58_34880 [Blastocatellia bacterium]|nr:hypothetical protein [Blastocatellia bacterium]